MSGSRGEPFRGMVEMFQAIDEATLAMDAAGQRGEPLREDTQKLLAIAAVVAIMLMRRVGEREANAAWNEAVGLVVDGREETGRG